MYWLQLVMGVYLTPVLFCRPFWAKASFFAVYAALRVGALALFCCVACAAYFLSYADDAGTEQACGGGASSGNIFPVREYKQKACQGKKHPAMAAADILFHMCKICEDICANYCRVK
jgi:hypothetical protein